MKLDTAAAALDALSLRRSGQESTNKILLPKAHNTLNDEVEIECNQKHIPLKHDKKNTNQRRPRARRSRTGAAAASEPTRKGWSKQDRRRYEKIDEQERRRQPEAT